MHIYMDLNSAWDLFDMYNFLWGVYVFMWLCTYVCMYEHMNMEACGQH